MRTRSTPPAPPDRVRRLTRLRVRGTTWLTPHMIRVTAGGGDIARFPATDYTDQYVKLLFPKPGVRYPEPFDIAEIRRILHRSDWPARRTYTVRRFDRDAGELDIDVVHHGDAGLAGPWAARARPGDEMLLLGPGGTYAPSPAADWHLLVGDASALPAIGAALERVPPGARAIAVVEIAHPTDKHRLSCPGNLTVHWIYPAGHDAGSTLQATVQALRFPPGRVHAFVHGEAGWLRELRRHLLTDRMVPRDQLSISGYWRRGLDQDGFRAEKARELGLLAATARG